MTTEGEEQKKPTGRIGRVKGWILAVGAVASALAAVYGLAIALFPALQPTQPSAEAAATLSNLKVEPDVTLGEYLGRPGVPAQAVEDAVGLLSEEQRGRTGSIVYFDVELRGFEGERCFLRWSVYDAESREPVTGLIGQSAWPSDVIVPNHQVSRAIKETWVRATRLGALGLGQLPGRLQPGGGSVWTRAIRQRQRWGRRRL